MGPLGSSVLANAVINIVGNFSPWSKGAAQLRRDLSGFLTLANFVGGGISKALYSPLATVAGALFVSPLGFARGAMIMGAVAFAASAVTASMIKTTQAFSDYNEQVERAKILFGSYTPVVLRGAEEMANKFGVSKKEFVSLAASIGQIFEGVAVDARYAAELSTKMTKLALDIASFQDIPIEQVFKAIRSGLAGYQIGLKRMGIEISINEIKARAMALGLTKPGHALTTQTKMLTENLLIMEKTARASEDMARSSGRWAMQLKRFHGEIENISVALGEMAAPMTTKFLRALNEILAATRKGIENINAGAMKDVYPTLKWAKLLGGPVSWISLYGDVLAEREEKTKEFFDSIETDAGKAATAIATAIGGPFAPLAMPAGIMLGQDKRNEEFRKQMQQEVDAEEAMNAKRKASRHLGFAEFHKQLQQDIFGDRHENLMRAQLDAAKKGNIIGAEQRALLEKMVANPKPAMAGK